MESPTKPSSGDRHFVSDPELTESRVSPREAAVSPKPLRGGAGRAVRSPELRTFLILTVGLIACFSVPLYDLLRFSLSSDLYSHVFLVPVISAYVAWSRRKGWTPDFKPASRLALPLAAFGIALLLGYWGASLLGSAPGRQDRLCLLTLAFVSFFAGACALALGSRNFRATVFPIAFLLFMVPMPAIFERGIESILQHASADASFALIKLSGMPVFRDGTVFRLPGLSLEVAPECSGIHSTLVLFMTALLAGHFFLRHTWTRTALVAGVVALGILRNAVRILTLAQLCVRVNPEILNSPLHRNGGPIFFLISLVPFLALIWILRKLELRRELKTDLN